MRYRFTISIAFFLAFLCVFGAADGQILLEKEWRFIDLTPTDLTDEKAIHILPYVGGANNDDLQEEAGSASLNSAVVAENWNANQMTILCWVRLNFSPGDGIDRYILETRKSAGSNRFFIHVDTAGLLEFLILDKDSTQHKVEFDITGWSASEWHQIACRLDFKNDEIELYTDGVSRDAVPDNALSNDSMDDLGTTVHIGADNNGASQLNGALTILVSKRSWDDSEILADYDSGSGTPFVVSPDTIMLGDFSQEGTGIVYHPGQLAISSISTVTLTLTQAADTKLVAGEEVVVYDDDDPANVVYTAVATVSGVTVTVDDSCAAVSGTNKTITRNLWVDGDQESSSTDNVSAGANQTITKDTSVVKFDGQSLKDVWAAADDNDESTLATMTLVSGGDYTSRLWLRPDQMHDDSTIWADYDGSATPILSREIGKSLDDRGNFARAFDLDATAQADGGNIHNIGTNDVGVWAWVKIDTDSGTGVILGKWNSSLNTPGWYFFTDGNGRPNIRLTDGDGTSDSAVRGAIDLRDNKWHFVAGYLDRDNIGGSKVFVDGVDDTTIITDTGDSTGTASNAGNFYLGRRQDDTAITFNGEMRDVGIAYPADIMAANEMGAAGEIANLYNNPGDPSQWPNAEGIYLCNDNAADTVVADNLGVNDLTASANTDTFAVLNWKYYEMAFEADQAAITLNLRITGAGAGTNSATVYVDEGEVLAQLVTQPGCEAADGNALPTGWSDTGTPDADETQTDTAEKHSGASSILLNNCDANEGVTQDVTVVVDNYYTFSFWEKNNAQDINAVLSGAAVTTIDITGDNSWTEHSFTFKAATTTLTIKFTSGAADQSSWIDDVTLTRLDTRAANTATKTPGFYPKRNPLNPGRE